MLAIMINGVRGGREPAALIERLASVGVHIEAGEIAAGDVQSYPLSTMRSTASRLSARSLPYRAKEAASRTPGHRAALTGAWSHGSSTPPRCSAGPKLLAPEYRCRKRCCRRSLARDGGDRNRNL